MLYLKDTKKIKIISKNNDKSYYIKIKWKYLKQLNIENWKYNRPHDSKRISSISKLINKQNYIDGIIYLSKVIENKGLEHNEIYICYDGIHRLQALKYLDKQTPNNINIGNIVLLVHYINDYDEDYVREKFTSLNKCVPVPEIYNETSRKLHNIQLIQEIVQIITNKYADMFKSTSRPNVPHQNRDIFTDLVTNIIEELDLYHYNIDDVIYLFRNFNNIMKKIVIENSDKKLKLSLKQKQKCEQSDCYLFVYKNWNEKFKFEYNKMSLE